MPCGGTRAGDNPGVESWLVADIRAEAGAAAAEEASAAMAAPVVHRSRRIPAAFQAALGVLTRPLPGVRPFPICYGIISAVASGLGNRHDPDSAGRTTAGGGAVHQLLGDAGTTDHEGQRRARGRVGGHLWLGAK